MNKVDFGHRVLVLRMGSVLSLRLGVRPLVVAALLIGIAAVAVWLGLTTGEFEVSTDEVLAALGGDGPRAVRLVVVQWRLPRILLALILGAALGLSGGIFQALTKNPLGSPDVIGFNVGAYSGVLVSMAAIGTGYPEKVAGALVGGLATAAAVYLFAYRRGVQGFRLIIVGIAISAVLASVNQWFIMKFRLSAALAAATWYQGSLNKLGWDQVWPALVVIGLLGAVLIGMGPRLRMLELGDDAAAALGVGVEQARAGYLVVGVALGAAATATAGPIAFVALAAPQVGRWLVRSAGISLTASATTGAVLLAVSDWLAQRLFMPTQLPVGVITVSFGGAYLVWLLVRQARMS
ncbi:iron-enterobactin transporter permease [Lentzea sp. NBRC 105346]|uniref:FecCD family ABC transporter permease n=1 Tax=Lentzea sp. NBRC 105346 TaxID=3032205 RepID=UPI0024A20E7A|nr:iron chelate uptake ABC transporter family permease subunit [Lentzea sp. NBRC 105346]GLZ35222.1 iron-enterobactin transporter permease [Lentzea sp. NBRC 105346]